MTTDVGLPVVLLPGMMCDERLFEHQVAALMSDRSVQVGSLATADTVEQLAENVLATAPAEFALAGLSMGGIVAMEIIRQAPERVQRLALLDTNPRPEADDVRRTRIEQIARVRTTGLEKVMREELKPNYLADGPRRAQVLDLCMRMALDLGSETFFKQSRALANRPDQRTTLQQIAVPTLILTGESDRLCPMDRHTLMHELIPHSTLVVISGAGHLPTLEQPTLTTEALQQWLQQA